MSCVLCQKSPRKIEAFCSRKCIEEYLRGGEEAVAQWEKLLAEAENEAEYARLQLNSFHEINVECRRILQADSTGFYKSREWRELRYEAIEKYGRRCMACGRNPDDRIKIHVDHIKPRSKHPELALEITNLQILCEDCNLGKSNKFQTDWRKKSETHGGLDLPDFDEPSSKTRQPLGLPDF